MANWNEITREDLLAWADTPAAKSELPILVRRLVHETASVVQKVDFPAGSGVSVGGFDGFVIAGENETFPLPSGTSVWELTVENRPASKPDEDYDKRDSVPDGSPTEEATYVELLCRTWRDARDWETEKRQHGVWKDVRAYNVDTLAQWLERAPATSAWFLERIHRPTVGLQSADAWWAGWVQAMREPIPAAVVLAGRDNERKQLRDLYASGVSAITVGGDVPLEEIQAFIAACVVHSDALSPDLNPLASKLVFASDAAVVERLNVLGRSLLVVLDDEKALARIGPEAHTAAIIPVPGFAKADITLPPVDDRVVEKLFKESGVDWRDAQERGQLARRSLLALRRSLASRPELHRPSWAREPNQFRRRLMLLGKWNAGSPGDRDAVCGFLGVDYDAVERELGALATETSGAMVASVEECWHLISPRDTWLLMCSSLTRPDLEAFQQLALTVLGETNPVLSMPLEERWLAGLKNIRMRYSHDLREGISTSLALLGSYGEDISTLHGQSGSSWASATSTQLFREANNDPSFKRWGSMAELLGLLAEAAPGELLAAMRTGTSGNPPLMKSMFTDSERNEFGSPTASSHTQFLFALERLAWSPDYFGEVVQIVGRLAELDPGGEWSNRPSATLVSIFRPVYPATNANLDQRIIALDVLRTRMSGVAWGLMKATLDNLDRGFVFNPEPDFRPWRGSKQYAPRNDIVSFIDAVADRMIQDAGSASQWIDVLKVADHFPKKHVPELCARLLKWSENASDSVAEVWQELRHCVARHKEYSDTSWAMAKAEVDQLDQVEQELRPVDPIIQFEWLFSGSRLMLGDVRLRDDFEAHDAAIAQLRQEAIKQVLQAAGLDGVFAFAENAEFPDLVGWSLVDVLEDEDEMELSTSLESDSPARVEVARGYFRKKFFAGGWEWLDGVLSSTPGGPTTKSRLVQCAWDPMAADERLHAMGDETRTHYWSEVSYTGLGGDFSHVVYVAANLCNVRRNAAALDMLSMYSRRDVDTVEFAQCVLSAFEGLAADDQIDAEFHRLHSWDFDQLFGVLDRHRNELDTARIVRVEWLFLPTLGYEPRSTTLHHQLAEDPNFFVEMMKLAYKPRLEEEEEESEASAQEEPDPDSEAESDSRRLAGNAHRLLMTWKVCPGLTEDGTVDGDKLIKWISESRALLADAQRTKIGDEQIGQILACAPPGRDGSFPCQAVCDAIETLANDSIDLGFDVRIHNDRGVTMRDPLAGGEAERDLAAQYRQHSDELRDRWPRVAAIYRGLVDSCERHARMEDKEAERRRRGI